MLVAPTVHGNLIVGPNAVVRRDPDDTSDTAAGLAEVRQKAVRTVPGVDFRQNIRNLPVCGPIPPWMILLLILRRRIS